MALTILEASKLNPGDVFRSAIVEMYAASSDILMTLPFENILGNALKYNREEVLPGIGFRGVNEAYAESTGVLNPITEALVIAGGDIDVDMFIMRTMGTNQRSVQEAMKIKALAHRWTAAFVKGDSAADPREFDGLQKRVVGSQLINAGATSGGDALSLLKLDEAIDRVDNPTHLLMNKTMRRLLTAAARSPTVSGYVTYTTDAFGRRLTQYNDIPIIIADEDNANVDILPFTEANPGGGAAASSSIYVLSMGEGRLVGLQNGEIDPRDLGELETKPCMRTRIEWYAGLAIFHGRAVARLRGIRNAAVTA